MPAEPRASSRDGPIATSTPPPSSRNVGDGWPTAVEVSPLADRRDAAGAGGHQRRHAGGASPRMRFRYAWRRRRSVWSCLRQTGLTGTGNRPPPGTVHLPGRHPRGSCRDRSAQRPRRRLRRSSSCRRGPRRRSWSCRRPHPPTVVVVSSTTSPTVVVVSSTTPPAVVVVVSTTHPRSRGEHGSAAAIGAATTSHGAKRRPTRSACGAPSARSSFPSQPSTSWGSTSVCDIYARLRSAARKRITSSVRLRRTGRAIPPMSVGRSAYVATIRAESRRNRHGVDARAESPIGYARWPVGHIPAFFCSRYWARDHGCGGWRRAWTTTAGHR